MGSTRLGFQHAHLTLHRVVYGALLHSLASHGHVVASLYLLKFAQWFRPLILDQHCVSDLRPRAQLLEETALVIVAGFAVVEDLEHFPLQSFLLHSRHLLNANWGP